MKNERVAEHLMAAIVLLKGIQEKNLQQNAEIQGFLDRLIFELEGEKKKEEEKDKEDAKKKNPGTPGEAAEAQKREKNGKKDTKQKPEPATGSPAEEADEEGEEEEAKLTGDAITKLMEAIMVKQAIAEAEKRKAAKEKATLGPVKIDKYATEKASSSKGSDPIGVTVGGGYGAGTPTAAPASNPGGAVFEVEKPVGVWCEICEEYHTAGEEEEAHDDLPF